MNAPTYPRWNDPVIVFRLLKGKTEAVICDRSIADAACKRCPDFDVRELDKDLLREVKR